MPIYEFQCSLCSEIKEYIQKFNDPPPDCGNPDCTNSDSTGKVMIRLVGATTFVLKGDCWERDGYKGKVDD